MDSNRYSSYHSGRGHMQSRHAGPKPKKRGFKVFATLVVLIIVAAVGLMLINNRSDAKPVNNTKTATQPAKKPVNTLTPAQKLAASECAGNTLDKEVVVSITDRHLWACQGTASAYDSPVVTGISYLAADLTPPGTYHVYAKYTDQTLTGCDSTGCWNDPVSYWMPFLDNQYGVYGFHDATWRKDSDFGNISPDSSNASHGCVELPLATAKWLYGWGDVGLTVVIQA